MIAAHLDQDRPDILARATVLLDGFRIPGGGVERWLAAVPACLIGPALDLGSPQATAACLFALVGRCRRIEDPMQIPPLAQASHANLAADPLALQAHRIWSGCTLVRILLRQGFAGAAERRIKLLLQECAGLPAELVDRFARTIEGFIAEAMALRARDLANEVA